MAKISKQYFLVEIDKTAQDRKRSQVGSILIPENFQDMAYNLQYGRVVEIGHSAHAKFPEVELNDILIFHHHVEYKPRTTGDHTYSDFHLIETLPNRNELRIVNTTHETFAVMKGDGTIIPFQDRIFCHADFKPASFQVADTGIYLPDAWRESEKAMEDKLEDLKAQHDNLQTMVQQDNRQVDASTVTKLESELNRVRRLVSKEALKKMQDKIDDLKKYFEEKESRYRLVEEVQKMMLQINKERELISKKLTEQTYSELTLLFINPSTCKDLQIDLTTGDTIFVNTFTLYPLDLDGVHFIIVQPKYVAGAITKSMKVFIPLHDRVLITPQAKETVTEAGIIIPDTAVVEKPATGIVEAVGPGKKEEPTTLRAQDEVVYGKNAGTPIEIEKRKYLLMREGDVYGKLVEIDEEARAEELVSKVGA